VIPSRVRRYLFTHYTPETLLNPVFEDLRKPKAPQQSLDPRVNCRCVSQPRWVGARRNTRGNKKGNRGSCCPAPRADALAVGGYKRSRGRVRERDCPSARSPAWPPFRTRALDLPFIDARRRPRCTMGGVAMC
jgi:hypothetical protein